MKTSAIILALLLTATPGMAGGLFGGGGGGPSVGGIPIGPAPPPPKIGGAAGALGEKASKELKKNGKKLDKSVKKHQKSCKKRSAPDMTCSFEIGPIEDAKSKLKGKAYEEGKKLTSKPIRDRLESTEKRTSDSLRKARKWRDETFSSGKKEEGDIQTDEGEQRTKKKRPTVILGGGSNSNSNSNNGETQVGQQGYSLRNRSKRDGNIQFDSGVQSVKIHKKSQPGQQLGNSTPGIPVGRPTARSMGLIKSTSQSTRPGQKLGTTAPVSPGQKLGNTAPVRQFGNLRRSQPTVSNTGSIIRSIGQKLGRPIGQPPIRAMGR